MEQPLTQPILETLWWIIPDKLAGIRKPLVEDIPALKSAGIGAIVSVMDDPANLDLYQEHQLPYRWLPTKGGSAPSREQVQELAGFIDEQNQLGHGVAVHCTSGRRRTGTMLAAYLILKGSTYSESIHRIRTANPEVELREAQLTFLQAFAGE